MRVRRVAADAYRVEQHFFASKDGTRVPMFMVRKKTTTGPAPTMLWGYGGFNVPYTPAFSASRVAWMEQGGVFALANIRGGGEYGKAWHDGGRLHNKQNVFDDFIAASEYLIAQGITGKDQLAIQGGSNGGLLVGAVVNQRPDLFAAALPAVGVMDMLRFDRWTAGRYWVDAHGNFGCEGGPALGNLAAAMQMAGGAGGRPWTVGSRFGSAGGDGSGFLFFNDGKTFWST